MKKEPEDRSKLKIASFRTTDGDWFDFSQAAESNGLTATDVLKTCMVEYLAGTYTPAVNTPVSMRLQSAQGLAAEDVQELIRAAISALPGNELRPGISRDDVQSMIDEALGLLQATGLESNTGNVPSDILARVGALEAAIELKPKVARSTSSGKDQPKKAVTTRAEGEPTSEVKQAIQRLKSQPELKARVEVGLSQGLTGEALGQFLADGGFLNSKGEPHQRAALSRFKVAIEYMQAEGKINE